VQCVCMYLHALHHTKSTFSPKRHTSGDLMPTRSRQHYQSGTDSATTGSAVLRRGARAIGQPSGHVAAVRQRHQSKLAGQAPQPRRVAPGRHRMCSRDTA
jgi:hypothetical protein